MKQVSALTQQIKSLPSLPEQTQQNTSLSIETPNISYIDSNKKWALDVLSTPQNKALPIKKKWAEAVLDLHEDKKNKSN